MENLRIHLYYLTKGVVHMNLLIMGVAFPHPKGSFCPRMVTQNYVVCDFETPFLYERDGALLEGKAGDILIMEPGQVVYHGPRKEAKEGFVNDWFHIRGDDFGALLERHPLPLNQAFHVPGSHFLRPYAQRAWREFQGNDPGRLEMLNCILSEMVIELHRSYTSAHSTGAPHDAVRAVRDEMLKNPGRAWRLGEMAAQSGYSVSRFSEIYCEQFGQSPMREVLERRIALAKQLLSSGQASVSYVAEACGFRTVQYFTKYFRETTGRTPSAYMKRSLEEKE